LTASKHTQPQLTFVARYYPPSPNINGESVCDMAAYLLEHYGIESNIICMDRKFEGGGQNRTPVGRVIRLKTISEHNNPILRFASFLYDGFVLIKKSLEFKDSILVCTTSPPLLPFWASMLYNKNIKWGLWTLDLFPEGFNATGLIGSSNPFYRWVKKRTYRGKPSFLIALGPKQHEYLNTEFGQQIPASTLPCGVFFYQDKSTTPPAWYEDNKLFLGYCGNVGDAHNPDFIKATIDNIDPEKHRLVLALYGHKAPALKAYAKGKPGVILVDNVPRNQLHYIAVHLVSLQKKWTHIAVPSKAVSAVAMGSAVLFCGHQQSDNWHLLQNAAWFIDENEAIAEQVADFIRQLNEESIELKRSATPALYKQLQQYVLDSYREVAERVQDFHSSN
jgi:hypothetical protein